MTDDEGLTRRACPLRKTRRFDAAIADFSSRYVDQNERDYEAPTAAVKSGRVKAEIGLQCHASPWRRQSLTTIAVGYSLSFRPPLSSQTTTSSTRAP